MESRAPYALIGLFMACAIAAVFGFVYWLHNTAGLQNRVVYRIQFENTVSGLVDGAGVLFNGIRVGEVTRLQLLPENPRHVIATIAVVAGAPIRPDTKVGLDFQGLTGVPVITLQGGAADAPDWAPGVDAHLLIADPSVGISMGQAAREALLQLAKILTDNAEPLRTSIANITTFSAALARNSDRLDPIISGLEKMTGGGAEQAPPDSYDLKAPRIAVKPGKTPGGQFTVAEPTVVITLDTQKIIVREGDHSSPGFGKAQWRDNIPKLLQARIIQSFENAGLLSQVSRPIEGVSSSHQLLIDLRSFEVVASEPPVADIEFSAKLMSTDGRIAEARIFHATAPASTTDVNIAVAGLNEAFDKADSELVLWTGDVMSRR